MGKYALNYIYLSRFHAGGKDQFALNLLAGICKNNNIEDYVVFCFDYSEKIVKKLAPGMQVVTIKAGKERKGFGTELRRLINITRINTTVIPKLIKEYDVDVIFHASCTNGLKKFSVQSVVIPHDIKAVSHRVMGEVKISMYKYLLYRVMYTMDFKHADKIVAISKADKSEMQNYFPAYKEKIVQIYNPIKVEHDNDVKESCDSMHQGDIVAINLQFHHKNVITLIKAFEKIKDEISNNLVLVGTIPNRVNYLVDYVKEHNLEGRVIFTGFVDGKQKRRILTGSALYVNPSLFEGFGMTAVEAMILKVPTLLSRVSANYEVTRGLCNYYEPADDENALAASILHCLRYPSGVTELEEKSNQMYQAYNYQKIAAEYQRLFTEIAADKNS